MRLPTRRSGSEMDRDRTSIMLPGWKALKNKCQKTLSKLSGLLLVYTTFMSPRYWWVAVSTTTFMLYDTCCCQPGY